MHVQIRHDVFDDRRIIDRSGTWPGPGLEMQIPKQLRPPIGAGAGIAHKEFLSFTPVSLKEARNDFVQFWYGVLKRPNSSADVSVRQRPPDSIKFWKNTRSISVI